MKKYKNNLIVTLFLLSIAHVAFTQEKIHCSLSIEPIYSYRYYKLKESKVTPYISENQILTYFKNIYDSIEDPKIGFGCSFEIDYKLNSKISLKSGIEFKNIGERTKLFFPNGSYTYQGDIVTYKNNNTYEFRNNTYAYLSIPFLISYNFFNFKKSSIEVVAGTGLDILVFKYIYENYYYYYSYYQNNYEKYNLKYNNQNVAKRTMNFHLGFRFNYTLLQKYNLYFQPEYVQYYFANVRYHIDNNLFIFNINQYNYYSQIKIGLQL